MAVLVGLKKPVFIGLEPLGGGSGYMLLVCVPLRIDPLRGTSIIGCGGSVYK